MTLSWSGNIFLFMIFLVSCAQSTESIPDDVTDFRMNADDCQHLSGEWDSSLPETEKRKIEKQVDIVCSKAKVQQKILKARYQNDKGTLNFIKEYDF